MALTPKQRAHLRSMAHPLKPSHQIGREGLTEGSLAAIAEAFHQRELVKVKVQQASPLTARETADVLPQRLPGVELIQVIGRTIVLYRRHPDRPRMVLP